MNGKRDWRTHKLQVVTSYLAFFYAGLCDTTAGALLLHIQDYYNASYASVSKLFLVQVVGYGSVSLLSGWMFARIGECGLGLFGAFTTLAAMLCMALAPPLGGAVALYLLQGFAIGSMEALYNAVAGSMTDSILILSGLHGFYGLGGVVTPVLSTFVVSHLGLPWYWYYAALAGVAATLPVMVYLAFRKPPSANGLEYEELASMSDTGTGMSDSESTRPEQAPAENVPASVVLHTLLSQRYIIMQAIFMVSYLGCEIGFSGWIVTYMVRVRGGSPDFMGWMQTAFWVGLTAGRFALSVLIERMGRVAAMYTLLLVCVLGLGVLWVAPWLTLCGLAITVIGAALGPMFPIHMAMTTEFLPPSMHMVGIGFLTAFGAMGSAVLPYLMGVLATSYTPVVVLPFMAGEIAVMTLAWWFIPHGKRLQ